MLVHQVIAGTTEKHNVGWGGPGRVPGWGERSRLPCSVDAREKMVPGRKGRDHRSHDTGRLLLH